MTGIYQVSNYTPCQIGLVKGERGENGANGANGVNGKDGKDGKDGLRGLSGSDGKSNYQLALDAGFIGSLADYQAELRGVKGEDGTDATIDFLPVETGAAGTPVVSVVSGTPSARTIALTIPKGDKGADGKSAYQSALDNGFIGTEAEWKLYLKSDGSIQALQQFMTNDASTEVSVPDYGNIPSLQGYISTMFENGGLPAEPFATKALMTASALIDGDYAQVTDGGADNGLYIKTAGAWVKSNYDPLGQALAYVDSNALFKPQEISSGDSLDTYLTNGIYVQRNYASDGLVLGYPTKNARGFLTVKGVGGNAVQRFDLSDNGRVYTRTGLGSPIAFTPWKRLMQEGDLKEESLYTQLEWQGRETVRTIYDRDTKTVNLTGLLIAAYKGSSTTVRLSYIEVVFGADPAYEICYLDLAAVNEAKVVLINKTNQSLFIKTGTYASGYTPEIGKVPLFKYDERQDRVVPCAGYPPIEVTGGAPDTPVVFADVLPKGFYDSTTTQLIAYTQVKDNLYVGFKVLHRVNTDEIVYKNYWAIENAAFYALTDGAMVANGLSAISIGESEFVINHNDTKDDATGGYHGDEQTLSVMFLADGIPIDMSVPHALTPCSDIEYIVKSTLHETAEGGVAIAGHPVIGEHWKRTKFSDSGYTTYNKVQWSINSEIKHFYHGISCISKDVAKTVMSGVSLTPIEMTGSGSERFREAGGHEYIGWNSTTGLSVHADSRLIYNSSGLSTGFFFVSDRNTDSKYYCKDSSYLATVGSVIETEFTCKFSSNQK